jgi:hypothetical protein
VHAISDPAQLGGHLSPDVIAGSRTLSGVVYALDGEGSRVPVERATVSLDGLGGMGFVSAATVTDVDGRYVLCGLDEDTTTYLFASKEGYRLFEQPLSITTTTRLDIELRR